MITRTSRRTATSPTIRWTELRKVRRFALYRHCGRNDIQSLKTAKDSRYLYFTRIPWIRWPAEARHDESAPERRHAKPEPELDTTFGQRKLAGSKASVGRYDGSGFVSAGEADIVIEGNKIMLRIDRSLLGLRRKNRHPLQMGGQLRCGMSRFTPPATARQMGG